LEAAQRAGKRSRRPSLKGGQKKDTRTRDESPAKRTAVTAPAWLRPARPTWTCKPACRLLPFCGGDVEHERDAEQWQVDSVR